MTTPLLEGLDGVDKMSKSLGNYVGITETPDEMFGKLMSISDDLMWRYYLLLTDRTTAEIDALRARVGAGDAAPEAGEDRSRGRDHFGLPFAGRGSRRRRGVCRAVRARRACR